MAARTATLAIALLAVVACKPTSKAREETSSVERVGTEAAGSATNDANPQPPWLAELLACGEGECAAQAQLSGMGEAARPALMEVALDPGQPRQARRRALQMLAKLEPRGDTRTLARHARSLWDSAQSIDDATLRRDHYRALEGTRSDDEKLFEAVKQAFMDASRRGDAEDEQALHRALIAFPSHTLPFALHAMDNPEARTRLHAQLVGECATEADLPLLNEALNRKPSPLVSLLLARIMVLLGDVDKADIICEQLEASEAKDEGARNRLRRRHIEAARTVVEIARNLTREQRLRALRALEAGLESDDAELRDPYREAADALRRLDPTPE